MIQLITNTNGTIVSTNNNLFKSYKSIFDLGFKPDFFELTLNTNQTLLINFFQQNYIVQNLRMNLNEMGLIYLLFEEYTTAYINIDSRNDINSELYFIINFDSIEQTLMFALRNGYMQDKEICLSLAKISGVEQDLFKIQYTMRKLYKKFDVSTRSSLLREIYFYKLDRNFPTNLFKPGLYNLKYQQLQPL